MTKSIHEIVSEARDIRTAEANKKGFIGPKGKLALIAINLGNPITHHDYIMTEFDEYVIPGVMCPSEHYIRNSGYYFKTASHRKDLEIKVDGFENGSEFVMNSLSVYWNSDLVFQETENQLVGYNPGDWETTIEHNWNRVEKIIKIQEKNQLKNEEVEKERLSTAFLNWMERTWGVKFG